MNTLQRDALKKYNVIAMGNGGDYRALRLHIILELVNKTALTEQDIIMLQHFIMSDKQTISNTTYIANSIISPNSWNYENHTIKPKTAKK
jgi:hypothetical protein